MSFSQTHTGLSITGEKLKLVELTYGKDGILLENIDEEYFEEYLNFFNKETKFNSILQKAFDELLIRKPLKNKIVSFALPYDVFKFAELPFDHSLIKSDLLDQLKWELAVLYPSDIKREYLLQYIEVNDDTFNNSDTAFVIAAMKKQIQTIHKFCVRNNLKLKYIDYAHFAVNNLIKASDAKIEDGQNISLFIGNNYFSFHILKQNSPVFSYLKKIINAADIIPQIKIVVEKLNQFNFDITSANNFYISGENISDKLVKQINDSFNINFVKLNPFSEFVVDPALVDSKFLTKDYNSFADAAGMSLRLL